MQADFQARATEEGAAAQDLAERVLVGCGFSIRARRVRPQDLGPTVNFVVADPNERDWYVDVSGAFTSERAGLIRTDTLWKALGRASVLTLNGIAPVILMTTNLPKPGSVGDRAMRSTSGRTFLDAFELLSPADRARLRAYGLRDIIDRPLPGFWTPHDLYGPELFEQNSLGARRSAPLRLTGDPLGRLVPESQARGLAHRLKVFIPSERRDGTPIPGDLIEGVLDKTRRLLLDEGGGFTSQGGRGHWVDPLGRIASEEVVILEAYMAQPVAAETIHRVSSWILTDLDQEVAALIVDDRMYQFDG